MVNDGLTTGPTTDSHHNNSNNNNNDNSNHNNNNNNRAADAEHEDDLGIEGGASNVRATRALFHLFDWRSATWPQRVHAIFDPNEDKTTFPRRYYWLSVFLQLLIIGVTLTSVVSLIVSTLPRFVADDSTDSQFNVVENICISVFTLDLVVRSATATSQLFFWKDALNWVDLLCTVPFYIQLIFASFSGDFIVVFRLFKLVRLLRVAKSARYAEGIEVVANTIIVSKDGLLMYAGLVGVQMFLFATAIYFVERGNWDEKTQKYWRSCAKTDNCTIEISPFQSVLHASWIAMVAATTVGYGDEVPNTPAGKVVVGLATIFGVFLIAFPAMVLSSRFNAVVAEVNIRRRHRAALLAKQQKMMKKNEKESYSATKESDTLEEGGNGGQGSRLVVEAGSPTAAENPLKGRPANNNNVDAMATSSNINGSLEKKSSKNGQGGFIAQQASFQRNSSRSSLSITNHIVRLAIDAREATRREAAENSDKVENPSDEQLSFLRRQDSILMKVASRFKGKVVGKKNEAPEEVTDTFTVHSKIQRKLIEVPQTTGAKVLLASSPRSGKPMVFYEYDPLFYFAADRDGLPMLTHVADNIYSLDIWIDDEFAIEAANKVVSNYPHHKGTNPPNYCVGAARTGMRIVVEDPAQIASLLNLCNISFYESCGEVVAQNCPLYFTLNAGYPDQNAQIRDLRVALSQVNFSGVVTNGSAEIIQLSAPFAGSYLKGTPLELAHKSCSVKYDVLMTMLRTASANPNDKAALVAALAVDQTQQQAEDMEDTSSSSDEGFLGGVPVFSQEEGEVVTAAVFSEEHIVDLCCHQVLQKLLEHLRTFTSSAEIVNESDIRSELGKVITLGCQQVTLGEIPQEARSCVYRPHFSLYDTTAIGGAKQQRTPTPNPNSALDVTYNNNVAHPSSRTSVVAIPLVPEPFVESRARTPVSVGPSPLIPVPATASAQVAPLWVVPSSLFENGDDPLGNIILKFSVTTSKSIPCTALRM